MIICKKCGAENDDNSVFCGKCGARIDGKIPCPACGNLVNEGNTFCNWCGARIDGKIVCPKCGNVYTGNFCPKCGSGTNHDDVKKVNLLPSRSVKKVCDVIKISLLLSALVLLFTGSFLVGLTKQTSFTYLISEFKEIAQAIDAAPGAYPDFYAGLLVPSIVNALAIAANIITSLVYTILGTIAFAKHFISNKPVSMTKYLIPPVVTSLLAYATVLSGTALPINIWTILVIVFVSILAAASAVLQLVIDGKKTLTEKRLSKYITLGLAAIFAMIALVCCSAAVKDPFPVSVSISYYFMIVLSAIGVISDIGSREIKIENLTVISFVIFIAIAVLLTIALKKLLGSIADKDNVPPKTLCALTMTVISFALSIAYTVLSAVLVNKTGASIGYGPIVALIMTAFSFVSIIVCKCLCKTKNTVNITSTSN